MGDLTGRALVLNVGSTSLKVAMFANDNSGEPVWTCNVDDATLRPDRLAGIERVLRSAPELSSTTVVGHRVVHGGQRFFQPTLVDADVEAAIAELEELAPLHNRAALDGICAARRVLEAAIPQVAVFDTAFHRTLPPSAHAYGGPKAWLDQGLRRYGFHGISHQHAAHTTATLLDRPLDSLRLVTCHLGGGCSLAAIDRGRSVDTTMGFTPLDGLVMSTRSGSVDPGLILHLLRAGATVDELERLLDERSGLLGLSGVSASLPLVLAARDKGDAAAQLAVDVFVHRVAAGIGSMLAALGGADAIAFTGGIGEHVPEIRWRVCERFTFVGVALDRALNDENPADTDLSVTDARVRVLSIQAREELAIARDAFRVTTTLVETPDE